MMETTMKRWISTLLCAAVCTMAGANAAEPEKKDVSLSVGSMILNYMPVPLTQSLGNFQKEGLNVKVENFQAGGSKALQALIAGSTDAVVGFYDHTIHIQAQGKDIVSVALLNTTPGIVLAVRPDLDIKSGRDLKGKKIGVSTFGGDSHASVLLSIKALGLKQSDVTIVEIGGDAKRQAALKAGAIAAAPVDSSDEAKMKELGFNILVHLKEAPTNLARESIMVRKDFAQKNPNTVLDLVAANMAALQQMYADPNKAADGYFKWIGTGDLPGAQNQNKLYLELGLRDMRGPADGWNNLQEVMATANAKLKNVDVKNGYTLEYLDKLKSLGFDKAVGVPGA